MSDLIGRHKGNQMAPTTNLFVYGTLMPGAWNHGLIESKVHSARLASTRGILCGLGSIPAMIPGDGIVRGVLLSVDTAAIAATDRLEGVPHFYRRIKTTVTCDDGSKETAWVYEYAAPDRLAGRPLLVIGQWNGVSIHAWRIPQ